VSLLSFGTTLQNSGLPTFVGGRMSLFSSIGNLLKPALRAAVAGFTSGIPLVGPAVSAAVLSGARLPATPQLTGPIRPTMVLPGIGSFGLASAARLPALLGRIPPSIRNVAGGVVAGATAGRGLEAVVDQFGQPVRKKRRRINPTNAKALKRALRRIEMYSAVNKRVERSLRKISPPRRSRTRTVPSHQHTVTSR